MKKRIYKTILALLITGTMILPSTVQLERSIDRAPKRNVLSLKKVDTESAEPPWKDWKHYHNYTEIVDILLYLNNTYSDVIDVFPIGQSWQGRTIYCARLTCRNNSDVKPKILFVGYHHSREQISAELPLYFLVQTALNYDSNETIASILDLCEIFVVPALNPDGFDLFEINDRQRKNAHPIDDDEDGLLDEDPPEDEDGDGFVESLVNVTNGEIVRWEGFDNDADGKSGEDWVGGVDLNRNYDYAWNSSERLADSKSEVYCGPTAFSEPETQAMRDLTFQNRFMYAVSFHSGGEYILCIEDHLDNETMNLLLRIGQDLSAVVDCPCETIPGLAGSWDDWMLGNRSAIALTCEVFEPPHSETVSEPGPYPDTVWRGGYRYSFNPRPEHIEDVLTRWMPVFFYMGNRVVGENVADLNKDSVINIIDISIVATSYGSTVEDPSWNAVADLDKDGQITIVDISIVAKHYGRTLLY